VPSGTKYVFDRLRTYGTLHLDLIHFLPIFNPYGIIKTFTLFSFKTNLNCTFVHRSVLARPRFDAFVRRNVLVTTPIGIRYW